MPISPDSGPSTASPLASPLNDFQRARFIALITELYAGARDKYWHEAEQLSELISGYPTMDMISPDEFRARLEEML